MQPLGEPNWQGIYEGWLLKARRSCEDARSQLNRIGYKEAKDGQIGPMIERLKQTEADISSLWERIYGPEGDVT